MLPHSHKRREKGSNRTWTVRCKHCNQQCRAKDSHTYRGNWKLLHWSSKFIAKHVRDRLRGSNGLPRQWAECQWCPIEWGDHRNFTRNWWLITWAETLQVPQVKRRLRSRNIRGWWLQHIRRRMHSLLRNLAQKCSCWLKGLFSGVGERLWQQNGWMGRDYKTRADGWVHLLKQHSGTGPSCLSKVKRRAEYTTGPIIFVRTPTSRTMTMILEKRKGKGRGHPIYG